MKSLAGRCFSTFSFCIFLLLLNTCAFSQNKKWQELQSITYGANSFSAKPIYTLGEDFNMQVLYAPVGNEIFRWKGGLSSWEAVGTAAPLQANGDIFSVTTDLSHNVYTAGYFSNAQGNYYVAKASWMNGFNNYTGWSELGGTDALKAKGPIYTIAADNAGNIYAAGALLSQSTGKFYVARFNGTSWSETGPGSSSIIGNGYIYSLCADGINLYAAGAFYSGTSNRYVAKWNGTTWSQLGTAFATNGDIKALAADGKGNIYAAGRFKNAAGKNYVAKWNGSNWQELPGLNANGDVYTLYSDGVSLFAGGDFTNANGKNYVARWDGNTWTETGSTTPLDANNTIYACAADATGKVFAGGEFTNHSNFHFVANYNPATTAWAETASSATGTFDASNVTSIGSNGNGDTIYTAGCMNSSGSGGPVSRWDQQKWSAVGTLAAGTCVNVMRTDGLGRLYGATNFDGYYSSYVRSWDGQSWNDLGNGKAFFYANGGTIEQMRTDDAGNLYCTGPGRGSPTKYFVAKWDGQTWAELGTGIQALNSDEPISGFWVDKQGAVYVCCYKYFNWHIAKWNGTDWVFLENSPNSSDISLNEMSTIITDQAGSVYSDFSSFNGSFFRKWDGTKWTILYKDGIQSGIVVDKKDNWFSIANGAVHRWDGKSWQKLGTESPGEFTAIRDLYEDNNQNLYVVGQWGKGALSIAKFDHRNLLLPLLSNITNKCADAPTERGKLYNPVSPDSLQVFQDGQLLAYRSSDSSFEYFTKGASVPGNHIITARYRINGELLTDSISYRVNAVTIPVVSLSTPSPVVCMSTGFNIRCVSNVPVSSYQWYLNYQPVSYPFDTTITDALQPAYPQRTYWCHVVLSPDYCYSNYQLNSDTIVMIAGNTLPAPTASVSSDDADGVICNNQIVKFTAVTTNEGSKPVYQWYRNGLPVGNGSKIYQTDSLLNGDRIGFTVSNNVPCITTATGSSNTMVINKDTSILRIPEPAIKICAAPSLVVYPNITAQAGYTYQWQSQPAGFSSDQANPLISPNRSTFYLVTRTNTSSGCKVDGSFKVTVDSSCNANAAVVYPNPSNGLFTVALTSQDQIGSTLSIASLSGGTAYTIKLDRLSNQVALQWLPNGLYAYWIAKGGTVFYQGRIFIIR